ncbi:DASS family sodium-coupled anion symporter [Caldimonas tepidiphila]|uniref:DASS family sodium-coupled anion symporter n=1 Tax=Caldimonas tepidiphila TaxID=2315841 RepID=UPI000E5ABEBF|nr:DASS family sodium-coupled anion symporter [Caldimonas tepidiphila]
MTIAANPDNVAASENRPSLPSRLPLLALCCLLAGLTWAFAPEEPKLRTGLTLFVLIASLWLTEALDLTVTALLLPLACVLAGVFNTREALASFANPIIFLFLGGFALASALVKHGLDRMLAAGVLRLAGGRLLAAALLLFAITALLSMWISNTAAAAMMLPLALGLLNSSSEKPDARTYVFLLLGLAYASSIGGIGTLVGSPPNAIAAAQAGISFAEWLSFGLPIVALLLPLMVASLWLVLRPQLAGRIKTQPVAIGWTAGRVTALVIFALTVAGWVGGTSLSAALGIKGDFDSVVALAAILALCVTRTVTWRDIEGGTHWGVLLLFGGGLALSQMMGSTGASKFLAQELVGWVQGAPVLVLMLAVVAFVVMLTELVSNTASAALLVPIFMSVSAELGLPPALLATAIAVSASCAFMLPVATPPNAIAYGTGHVPQALMMRCGLVLNMVCLGVVTAVVYFAR